MKTFVVILAAIILLAVCALHIYWAFCGNLGADVAMPTDKYGNVKFKPKPWMILIVAVMIFVAFLILLFNFIDLEAPLLWLFTDICFFVFLLRGLYGIFRFFSGMNNAKAVNKKLKYEICCFTPICLIAALGFLFYI